jgi:hypothetical protein
MAGRRASVFAEDIDVSDFQPAAPAKGEQRDRVKAVAEPAAFHSRDPAPTPPRREPRRHRTGRNVQLTSMDGCWERRSKRPSKHCDEVADR